MTGRYHSPKSAICGGLDLLLIVLNISQYECYTHKRDLMPQITNILSDGLREELKQTQLLDNITATCTSAELGVPRVIDLLENQAQHLANISVIVAHEQAKQTQLLETISVALEKLLSRNFPFTARDCSGIASQGPYRSGIYTISPWDEQGSFKVYCDMDTVGGGEGWTVIQKRFDGSVDFSGGWEEYKNGFGDINGEMWLGLAKLNRLTSVGSWMLRVELTGFNDSSAYAQYDDFAIGDESTNFALTSLGKYAGTAGNAFNTKHLNMAFTTINRDNDRSSSNCARTYGGAWWYNKCYDSNLNGPYLTSAATTWNAIVWDSWKAKTALKATEMKIKLIE
ncbi:microfibril-associated glycoprotein 4-like [Amphiura filiformis]|uniref:microfibril-associated glycoprotein 4-like n=1 Tax=Amphiura filiformis TaxID=82378 RepID=UPI003B221A4B